MDRFNALVEAGEVRKTVLRDSVIYHYVHRKDERDFCERYTRCAVALCDIIDATNLNIMQKDLFVDLLLEALERLYTSYHPDDLTFVSESGTIAESN